MGTHSGLRNAISRVISHLGGIYAVPLGYWRDACDCANAPHRLLRDAISRVISVPELSDFPAMIES